MNWHQLDTTHALRQLQSDPQSGLTPAEAQSRQAKYGPNELVEKGGRTPLRILWEQLTATMVLILITAAFVSALLGDAKNAISIMAIVLLFAALGFIQEYRAEQAIASLKRLAVPNVRAVRAGELTEISARDLTPGDIVQLEAGNIIPADLRLLDAVNLRVQEAALTGESEAVEKRPAALDIAELPLGDRRNMAYMGTVVTQGRGKALVVAVGMDTELGKIADLIQQAGNEQTPLQRRLDQLGKWLALVGVAIAGLILILGLLRGDDLRHMLLTAVSVAVAIVPEGLPAVVTVTLALGAQRMLRLNALIRRLPAVETLGSVTVICSDKTGTLTKNEMTVVVLDVAGHALDLTAAMRGSSVQAVRTLGLPVQSSLSLLTIGGALCNDAMLVKSAASDRYHTIGDPTEGALVSAAARMGYWKATLDADLPRAAEAPFDSDRKRMTTIHALPDSRPESLADLPTQDLPYIGFTKGSVDGLLDLSTHVWTEGRPEPLDAGWRERIEAANANLAGKGMRVLGVAYRLLDQLPPEPAAVETGLTFVGLFGLIDPPRSEVRDAIAVTRTAGVRTVMITGDHPLTASEIAAQLGISDNGRALTGLEVDRLSPDELKVVVEEARVFARVSPEHKLRIVQALQEQGHIVAMTGDGVNDAPALRRADIGVAMGIAGTDVSKQAADLVLLDDNFATIVAAAREGRTIYDNIRKFVRFSVAGNIGKVMVMLLAPFLGNPIPLLPLQLLWLNLLTDGLLGLGLGVEPAERDTMRRPPYSPQEGVFSRGAGIQTAWIGVLIGIVTLAVGAWYYFAGRSNWQTLVFTTLAFAQVGQALAARSHRQSLFTIGLRSNLLMLAMALVVVLAQLAVIFLPPLQLFFETQPLAPADLLVAIAVGLLIFAAIELEKWFSRRTRHP